MPGIREILASVFIADHGVDLSLYLENWFETLPSAQLVVDLAIVFWMRT